jgi:hypothetical protein
MGAGGTRGTHQVTQVLPHHAPSMPERDWQAISLRTCTGLSQAAYLGLSYPPERAITGPILLDAANRADYLHERCSILPKRALPKSS